MSPAMRSREQNVLVIGGGCVGTYLALALKAAGFSVVLKGSQRSANALGVNKSPSAILCKARGVPLISSLGELDGCPLDIVFIATKTYDYDTVAAEIAQHKIRSRITVAVHNGIVEYPFEGPVVHIVCTQSFDFETDASEDCGMKMVVRNEKKPWSMGDTVEGREIAKFLCSAGVHAVASPEFEALLLKKYIVNGVANLLSVVADTNCQGLIEDHWQRMQHLYGEFVVVLSVQFPAGFAALPDDLHRVVFDCLASYRAHYPSTKRDFDLGRALELGSLNGYLQACARRLGIPTPHNDRLIADVKMLLHKRDGPQSAIWTLSLVGLESLGIRDGALAATA